LIAYTGRRVARSAAQQAAWRFDRNRNWGFGIVASLAEHVDQLREACRVVRDAFLGDQLSLAGDDCDVVMAFGPVDPAEQCHV
jgi:hypothetical protein